jgi:hypothetical protein
MTGHSIGIEMTMLTGHSVLNRTPAGTHWPIKDERLSRRLAGLQWGKSLKGLLSELLPNGWFTLEREQITLPSALAPGEINRLSLKPIALIEAELRKGQVTDALEGLRLALGKKSLCFRTEVCNANSQRTTH